VMDGISLKIEARERIGDGRSFGRHGVYYTIIWSSCQVGW
jgi:hypothetical protein